MKKQIFIISFLLLSYGFVNAQIEVANASAKGFNSIGFGGFLNFSIPVPFNAGIRYEHTCSNCATNILAFRISHSLHFGRRSDD